jgi:hypothetical protein
MASRTGVIGGGAGKNPRGKLPNLRNPMAVAFFFFWLWYATDTICIVGERESKNTDFIGSAKTDGGPALT